MGVEAEEDIQCICADCRLCGCGVWQAHHEALEEVRSA